MEIKCDTCGGLTEVRKGQTYHYKECGLDNVYLENTDLRVCEACGVATPRIRRILDLHSTIARAVALKPGLLSGAEIRFLRKHLGLKAREWAALLRIDQATLCRWEKGDQQIGPQSDALVRLLYLRILEEREGRMIPEAVAERIAASIKERIKEATVRVNMDNPALYSYHCA
jgi:putative zinc finger/helix-turn-helix YgiT family protein